MMMNKKAYYFTVEATLGILILATSFFVLLYFVESATPVPEYRYAENIAGYLSFVTLGELCSDGCEGMSLADLDLDNYSLMDVIGYKYSQSLGNGVNTTEEIITKGELLLRGRELAITLTGVVCDIMYSTQNISCEEGANVTSEIVFRKVIQGFAMDDDTSELEFWGDYVFEVRVW
jgi:hypothetical protein